MSLLWRRCQSIGKFSLNTQQNRDIGEILPDVLAVSDEAGGLNDTARYSGAHSEGRDIPDAAR